MTDDFISHWFWFKFTIKLLWSEPQNCKSWSWCDHVIISNWIIQSSLNISSSVISKKSVCKCLEFVCPIIIYYYSSKEILIFKLNVEIEKNVNSWWQQNISNALWAKWSYFIILGGLAALNLIFSVISG